MWQPCFFSQKKIESHETSHSKSNNNRTRRIYKQGLVIVSLNSCAPKGHYRYYVSPKICSKGNSKNVLYHDKMLYHDNMLYLYHDNMLYHENMLNHDNMLYHDTMLYHCIKGRENSNSKRKTGFPDPNEPESGNCPSGICQWVTRNP